MAGDLPSIIMIVVSIAFFLGSLTYALSSFDDGKKLLAMEQASLEAANAFMESNAKLTPANLDTNEEFWEKRMEVMRSRYGVNIYAELVSFCTTSDDECPCPATGAPTTCVGGLDPQGKSVKRKVIAFPVAVHNPGKDLYVYPGLIRVMIWM